MLYFVGTGRCGTKTVSKVYGGLHEPEPEIIKESTEYYLYGSKNDLLSKKLKQRSHLDTKFISDHKQSFVISEIKKIDPLCEFALLVREPSSCIVSFCKRNAYLGRSNRYEDNRIKPRDGFCPSWTQAMKCCWMWIETNSTVFSQVDDIPIILTSELGERKFNQSSKKRRFRLTSRDKNFISSKTKDLWEKIQDLSQSNHSLSFKKNFLSSR